MRTCRECGAPVRYAKTEWRRWMPLNEQPADDGTFRIRNGTAYRLSGKALEDARADGDPLYVPHWATCPYAEHFRKARQTPPPAQGELL